MVGILSAGVQIPVAGCVSVATKRVCDAALIAVSAARASPGRRRTASRLRRVRGNSHVAVDAVVFRLKCSGMTRPAKSYCSQYWHGGPLAERHDGTGICGPIFFSSQTFSRPRQLLQQSRLSLPRCLPEL